MDVCIPDNTLAHQDKRSNCWSISNLHNPSHYESEDLSLNHLRTCSVKLQNLGNSKQSSGDINLSSRNKDTSDVLKEEDGKGLDKTKSSNSTSEKCFTNCGSPPPLDEPQFSVDNLLGGERKKTDGKASEVSKANLRANSATCYSRSVSTLTPVKLVSAMKGTREKQGFPPKNLSVTWAPEVYDPIPTSVSHVPSYKNNNYRNGGNKYKNRRQKNGGKSPRGRKGKGKKQQACNNNDSIVKREFLGKESSSVSRLESQAEAVSVNVADSCGTIFFKKSVAEMHFPVAEAT